MVQSKSQAAVGTDSMGTDSIVIKNLGPNEYVEVPLPAEGGVTILRGLNDQGKTEALKAVSVLAGGKERISVRRDAPEGTKGEVRGRGVTVVIHKNIRRSGTAEFEVLDGDLGIEDIVDPGIRDPFAADAKRIKALLSVSNVSISPSEFYELCGGREAFAEAVGNDAAFDPLATATRVRAYLHKRARCAEEDAQAMLNKAAGLSQAYDGVDLSGVTDTHTLQLELEQALAQQAHLSERAANAAKDETRFKAALVHLEQAIVEYTGPTLEEAQALDALARQRVKDVQDDVDRLQAQLDAAFDALRLAKAEQQQAAERHNSALGHQRTMQRLTAVVQQGAPNTPHPDELTAASDRLTAARQALENGAKIRDAQKHLLHATQLQDSSTALLADAELFRSRADQVSTVLNKSVTQLGVPLLVHEERLVVPAGAGSFKFFDELSMGARRKIALDIAIDSVGPTGLIPLSQESWEGLDYVARQQINQHLRARQVNMVTAEADQSDDGHGGHVRAEVFQGQE